MMRTERIARRLSLKKRVPTVKALLREWKTLEKTKDSIYKLGMEDGMKLGSTASNLVKA